MTENSSSRDNVLVPLDPFFGTPSKTFLEGTICSLGAGVTIQRGSSNSAEDENPIYSIYFSVVYNGNRRKIQYHAGRDSLIYGSSGTAGVSGTRWSDGDGRPQREE